MTSRAPATHQGSGWSILPAEVLQLVGQQMDVAEWMAARLACKHWAANITAGIAQLEMDVEPDAHRAHMVLTCVARMFPQLASVGLLLSSRLTTPVLAERMAGLAVAVRVKELELRCMASQQPHLGAMLSDTPAALTSLLHLTSLRLSSGPTVSPESLGALTQIRGLGALELLPGVYGSVGGDLDPGGLAGEHPLDYGHGDKHAIPLGRLTSLTKLTVKAMPRQFTACGLAALTPLTRLQQLILYDTQLPSSCLHMVTQLAGLTELQIGLRDHDDLSPLTKLPALKSLFLEGADMPDVRQFVAAAASLQLPPQAKLTGLYLMDQVFPAAAHVACLSSLPHLQDLLLENPKLPEDQEADVVFDMQTLTALRDLITFQLDKICGNGLVLQATPATIRAVGVACTALQSLELYNLQPAELPAASIAAMSAISSLRSLSINAWPMNNVSEFNLLRRRASLWDFPPNLTSISCACFDFRGDRDRGHAALAELVPRFSKLQHLRMQACYLPPGFISRCLPPKLTSLDCRYVEGVQQKELASLSSLTALQTLSWQSDSFGLGPLDKLKGARMLKRLVARLADMADDNLRSLPQLTTLQVLSLEAEMVAAQDGGVGPEPYQKGMLRNVEAVAKGLPYCDVELFPAPEEWCVWPDSWQESTTVQRWDPDAADAVQPAMLAVGWGSDSEGGSGSEGEEEEEEGEQQQGHHQQQ